MDGWLAQWRSGGPQTSPLPWILVPLGNPGEDYAETRHNLGRLLLQRWMDGRVKPERVRAFATGTLYGLGARLQALVPATYMNLSGQVCREAAAAGIPPSRFVLLHDDKDLPLGMGRFRLSGSDGGHNGLRSVFECLETREVARLRLGIGPFTRPLDQFVLGSWTEAEWLRIEAMDQPFGCFLDALAETEGLAALPGRVNGEAFWASALPEQG